MAPFLVANYVNFISMKKSILVLLALCFSGFGLMSQQVTNQEAMEVASHYLDHYSKDASGVYPFNVEDVTVEGLTVARVVTGDQGGFVLVSPDKRMRPVVGYSRKGTFDVNNMPPALEYWLHGAYSDGIGSGAEHSYWQEIYSGSYGAKGRSFPEVPKLVSARWGQGWPYNAKCPPHPDGPNGHTLVGCVATAMAQIKYFWQYPASGSGSQTYYWDQEYTVDFSQAHYDYSQMDNNINHLNMDHISELLFHSAVATRMNFGPTGSSSSILWATEALKQNFLYVPTMRHHERSNYTYPEWKTMIQNEILNGRPVLYAGVDGGYGGHAFILDGFQDSAYFHINWGWSGSHDGYFHLNSLAPPGYDFTSNQRATIGIAPPGTDFCGTYWLTAPDHTFDDGSGYSMYQNNTSCTYLIEHPVHEPMELRFTRWQLADAGDVVTIYDGADETAPMLAQYDGTQTPGVLTSSSNKVFITFETDDSGQGMGWMLNYTSLTTSVCEKQMLDKLQVAPNPASEQVFISGAENSKAVIYSIDGRRLRAETIEGNSQHPINISTLTPGVYLMEVTAQNGERKVNKLMVQ